MDNSQENGYFKGTTEEAIRDIREDIRQIRTKLDNICEDHEKRLTSIETAVRLFKWLYGAVITLLAFLGLKP
jgi:uncharacterized protein YgfB (UPF0149 family)